MRRRLILAVGLLCAVLVLFATAQFFAIRALQRENEELRKAVDSGLAECSRVITEHRGEERDRDFKMTQTVQLEAARTRDYFKEICRP